MVSISSGMSAKRAALYLRRSKSHQEASLKRQEREGRDFATDNGIDIVAVFYDDNVTGVASAGVGKKGSRETSKKQRDGFFDMLAAAKNREFEYLICWEQFRASRSKARHVIQELNPIADENIKFIFMDLSERPIDLDELPDLLQVICRGDAGHKEPKTTARRAISGQREKAEMGLHVAGPTPYAMKSVQAIDKDGNLLFTKKNAPLMGRIVPGDDPEKIENVQLAFKWCLEGLTLSKMIEKAWSERRWRASRKVLQQILRHPYYVGDFAWNRRSKARFFAVRHDRVVKVPEDEKTGNTDPQHWVYKRDNHEGLVDRETWNRVQAVLVERQSKTTPYKGGGNHLLTGMCRCASCGSRFIASRDKKNHRVYVTCNGYREGICKANRVHQEMILGGVITTIESLLTPKYRKQLEKKHSQRRQQRAASMKPENLLAELAEREASYKSYLEKLDQIDPSIVGDFNAMLLEKKLAIEDTKAKLKRAKQDTHDLVLDFRKQWKTLDKLVANLQDVIATVGAEQPHLIRQLISSMVGEIILDVGDKGAGRNPRWYLKDGKTGKTEIKLRESYDLLLLS